MAEFYGSWIVVGPSGHRHHLLRRLLIGSDLDFLMLRLRRAFSVELCLCDRELEQQHVEDLVLRRQSDGRLQPPGTQVLALLHCLEGHPEKIRFDMRTLMSRVLGQRT